MKTVVFVSNLHYDEVDESALFELFSRFCAVRSAKIVRDGGTGRSKGFGFVEIVYAEDLAAGSSSTAICFINARFMSPKPSQTSDEPARGYAPTH